MTVDEAIAELEKRKEFLTAQCDGCWDPAMEMALQALKAQRTGKWIDHDDDGYVECPYCGSCTNSDGNIKELHYCFNCGARMVEE